MKYDNILAIFGYCTEDNASGGYINITKYLTGINISNGNIYFYLYLRYQENIANTSPYNLYHFGARAKHLYRSHTNNFYEMLDIGRHLVIKYETHQSELILF